MEKDPLYDDSGDDIFITQTAPETDNILDQSVEYECDYLNSQYEENWSIPLDNVEYCDFSNQPDNSSVAPSLPLVNDYTRKRNGKEFDGIISEEYFADDEVSQIFILVHISVFDNIWKVKSFCYTFLFKFFRIFQNDSNLVSGTTEKFDELSINDKRFGLISSDEDVNLHSHKKFVFTEFTFSLIFQTCSIFTILVPTYSPMLSDQFKIGFELCSTRKFSSVTSFMSFLWWFRYANSTDKKCNWAYHIFKDWIVFRYNAAKLDSTKVVLVKDIMDMADWELAYALQCFILEVRKKNGDNYPAETLYELVVSLQMFVNAHGRNIKFLDDSEYIEVRDCLDNRMKELSKVRNVQPHKKADIITVKDKDIMWVKGVLGSSNPKQLVETMLYLCGVHLHCVQVLNIGLYMLDLILNLTWELIHIAIT